MAIIKECKKALAAALLLLIAASLLLLGHTVSPKTFSLNPDMETMTYPIEEKYSLIAADKVAAQACSLEGVQSAVALPAGKSIYLGLDLNSNTGVPAIAEIEKKVLVLAKKTAPTYDLKVISDPGIVLRMKELVKENKRVGIPLSGYEPALKDIGLVIQETTPGK